MGQIITVHPVETILNLQPCPYGPEAQQPYNYTKTNWKIFEQKLGNYLPILTHFTQPTVETANQLASDISAAIRQAITETTPRADICSFSKRWWNEELADLRKQASELRKDSINTDLKRMRKNGRSIEKPTNAKWMNASETHGRNS